MYKCQEHSVAFIIKAFVHKKSSDPLPLHGCCAVVLDFVFDCIKHVMFYSFLTLPQKFLKKKRNKKSVRGNTHFKVTIRHTNVSFM